jgi:ABC-type sugar transport system substrate-binding protein
VGPAYYQFVVHKKKRLFGRMVGYVNCIQLVVYHKLWPLLEGGDTPDAAKRMAAAVVNKLFAKAPTHTKSEQLAADLLASELLKGNGEVRYAALMSLRAMMVVESARKNSAATARIMQTLQRMQQYWSLPLDPPDPDTLRELATNLTQKYLAQNDAT